MNFLNSREQEEGAKAFGIILAIAWPVIVIWAIANGQADEMILFIVPVSVYWLCLTVNSVREWLAGTDEQGNRPLTGPWWRRMTVEVAKGLAIGAAIALVLMLI